MTIPVSLPLDSPFCRAIFHSIQLSEHHSNGCYRPHPMVSTLFRHPRAVSIVTSLRSAWYSLGPSGLNRVETLDLALTIIYGASQIFSCAGLLLRFWMSCLLCDQIVLSTVDLIRSMSIRRLHKGTITFNPYVFSKIYYNLSYFR